MRNKYSKYNGCGTHRRAILHMIGQSQSVFFESATISEIAAWMNVSKPTARKYIKKLEENGEIIITKVERTVNSTICLIKLHPDMFEEYSEGMYLEAYKIYVQQVLKVILQ